MGFAIGSYPMGRTESSWLLCKSVVDSLGRGLDSHHNNFRHKKTDCSRVGLDVKRLTANQASEILFYEHFKQIARDV